MSPSTYGRRLKIGSGFEARSFKHDAYSGMMDPLIMVDYYTMTQPTFGPHGHAGLSAVSILFEDSKGAFNNRDSLGNDIDLMPGDLYWLKASRGAVHDEKPKQNAKTHALQVFVNLPARLKHDEPESLHVRASQMPVLKGQGYRVRVMLGESNRVAGAISPAEDMTILDGFIEPKSGFEHSLPAKHSAWIMAVHGSLTVNYHRQKAFLQKGQSISVVSENEPNLLSLNSETKTHFVLLQGKQIKEAFVQHGPFVMSTEEEIHNVINAYAAGELGSIEEN